MKKNSSNTSIRLSPSEERIFTFITQKVKLTTKELTRLYYNSRVPINGQNIVNGLTKRLEIKTRRQRPRIRREKRKGPKPIEVWLER